MSHMVRVEKMKSSVLLLLFSLLVAGCQTEAGNPPATVTPFVASPLSDAELFSKAKKTVLANLKDPDSAKCDGPFRRVVADRAVGKREYVCGRVNSKNGFGGYTGIKTFAFVVSDNSILMFGEHSSLLDPEVRALLDKNLIEICS